MGDFSEIPNGVGRKIAVEHLDNLEDVESLSKVCSWWRSETQDINFMNFRPFSNTQLPWLMLADSPDSSYRRFYSVSKGMYIKIDLPQFDIDPKDHRRYFSSKGWLIGVSRKLAFITFFDPFSDTVINPPSVPLSELIDVDIWDEYDDSYLCYFSKFIFSNDNMCDDDDDNSKEDFQVAMIFDKFNYITFWRPGEKKWVRPDDIGRFDNRQIEDVCFFRGEFYAIDHKTQVIAYGNQQQEPKRLPRIVANLCSQGLVGLATSRLYIVVSGISTLLVIERIVNEPEEISHYSTLSFTLTEFNVDTGKARRVEDIGNRALFVGYNSTFFVEVPLLIKQRLPRRNCIYFTTDNIENYYTLGGGGLDMGIYSLEERKVIDQVYQGPSQLDLATPPSWIELPHC